MGWISVVFVHKAVDALSTNFGLSENERRALFEAAGVAPGDAADPARMVSDTDYFGLLERIVREHGGGRAVPVLIGASMRCDDYGAFGLAFKTAPDLGGSFRRVERYGRIVTSIANFRLVEEGREVAMEVIPGSEQRLGLAMTNELAVAAAASLAREVSESGFTPARVEFMHDAPADNTLQQAYFRCPIVHNAERDALVAPAGSLVAPNRLGDHSVSAFFDSHLDRELDNLADPAGIGRQVRDAVLDGLSEGVPTLAQTAGRIGMSSRTLQRRLAADDHAYQDLVTEARRALAEQLLSRTDYALAEIAFLTGFSDQSTFSRAFKRWNGTTPAGYRREAR